MNEPPNIYQAPSEPAQSPALFPQDDEMPIEAAGFGIRAAARVIDTLVGVGFGFVAGVVVTVVAVALAAQGNLAPDWQRRLGALNIASIVLSFLGTTLYHSVAESMGGATVGKAILGLRVRREDMTPCTFGGALIRNLLYIVDAFFCGLVAALTMSGSRWQQRLGDKAGKTVVLRVVSLTRIGAQIPGVAGGILAGALIQIVLIIASFLVKIY